MEFFSTVMGHRFYESHVPKIADALFEIAKAMPRIITLLEQQAAPLIAVDPAARRDDDALREIAEVLRREPIESLNRVSLKVVANRISNIVAKTGRV